ncbi:MAG TPA: hypothetical protein H9776_06065 [Candidatus Mediterraneibacter intestinipullorum]|nr:hypothetical protein [Candidatus Mediterraneibacter intestinipullorum]
MSTAAKTPNYNLSQVAGSDIPDWITDYTSDMSKIDAALKENADDIATVRPDEFSEESTYAAGDYCIKDNVIYKAKTAVEAGAFDISDWTATTIFDELSGLNQKMSDSGWLIIPTDYQPIRYRKIGKWVELIFWNDKSIPQGTTIGTLPGGFRPSIPGYPNAIYIQDSFPHSESAFISVDASGNILAESDISSGWSYFVATYIAE